MPEAADWQQLASVLRELHRVLMERARRDYEREHNVKLSAVEQLRLLTADPYFDWLRRLSELMADIDLVRDAEQPVLDEFAPAVRAAVEQLVAAPDRSGPGHAFAQHYWPFVQDDPCVVMAHADVKRALAAWPRPRNTDAASLLHERHRLTEKARHRARNQ